MRDDAVTIDLNFLSEKIGAPTGGVFLDPITTDCCFELPAFGELGITAAAAEPLKNDFWPFLRCYEASISAVELFLFRPHDPSFADVALDDNTLGEFFELGFHSDEKGKEYIGYKIDWRKVLDAHGPEVYQIRADKTGIFPNLTSDFEFNNNVHFNLKNYTAELADGTIRIAFENSAILKDIYKQGKRIYYPPKWGGQIRLNGILTGNNADYEKTYTKYNNESLRQVSDRQIPKFRMRIELAPEEVHNFVATEVMQADNKAVTDYNRNNSWTHIETEIRDPSEYAPTDTETELLMDVDITFKDYYDTGLKKHCQE
jgi:hypothetical protein